MVWKQDLAKLKQQLGQEPQASPPKAIPKPTPKPSVTNDLVDEDAVFLAAMGRKPAPPARRPPAAAPEGPVPPEPPPSPVPETFQGAMEDLKGMKPLAKPSLLTAPAKSIPAPATPETRTAPPVQPEAPPPVPEPPVALRPAPGPVPDGTASSQPAPGAPSLPLRFQLAAGMAIEVDGVLDLRGHCRTDAMERLKDRLGDGAMLGWRSLQVILGPAPELHEALLELLNSGQIPLVSRYAQAPVPMGGHQAWLLYFGPAGS